MAFQNRTIPLAFQNRTIPMAFQNRTIPMTFQNRTIPVAFQNRTIRVAFQNRTIPIAVQNRTIPVAFQNRTIPVAFQNRTIPMAFQNRTIPAAFQNRTVPARRVFSRVCQALRGTGASGDVRVTAECEDNEDVGEQENTVQMVERSPCASAEELQDVVMFPKREWRSLHGEGKCRTACSLCKVSDLAI